jgi:general secretion pathway protein D
MIRNLVSRRLCARSASRGRPLPRFAWAVLGALLAIALAACATTPPRFPEPLRAPKPEAQQEEALRAEEGRRARPRVEDGPVIGVAKPVQEAPQEVAVPPISVTKPVALALDGVPLATFINVVFGTELGFAVEIEQSVRSRADLVTLRLTEPHEPEKLYRIAVEVLHNYGVRVTPSSTMLRFAPVANASSVPGLITTRALPDVPAGQRPVFVAMPLDVSEPGRVAAQVRSLLGNQQVTITEMVEANALLISGPGDSVQAAMDAVLALDRAALRDKRSVRINPLYLPADLLARELREVLVAQGFSVRSGPGSSGVLTFVPVASANALIIFSESEPALRAATEWAERLDQPTDEGGSGGVYLYSARHTTVETLVPVLEAMVGGSASGGRPAGAQAAQAGASDMAPNAGVPARQAQGSRATSIAGAGGTLAVDPVRNVIVYQGDAQRWRAIQGVLARLDQPARQVLIEVTVAEVSLTDEFSHGIEWALRNVEVDGMSGPLTALTGGAANNGGLVWRAISSSGQVRALVNLFARDSRVSILSTPRLLVKSGETASIDVGTEVPIITSQATAPDLPFPGTGPSILQSVQYRKTGVLLEIEAVVHSGQRVDLKVAQEVSEATQTNTSEISSPSIFSRRLQTSLSLADGESMLLGGLMSSSRTDGKTKVPLLGDIPVVGTLFQNRRKEGARTELLMLITPYVVEDASQAREITDAIRSQFGSAKP